MVAQLPFDPHQGKFQGPILCKWGVVAQPQHPIHYLLVILVFWQGDDEG